MNALINFLLVFIGGGLGSAARYGFTFIFSCSLWATFLVNALGSFLIGLFAGAALPNTTRLLLTVGFCGGFTTFSTFAKENVQLLLQGRFGLFALYSLSTLALTMLFAACGLLLARFS